MENKELLELLKNKLDQLRYTQDENGQKKLFTRSEDAQKVVAENFGVVKDNFTFFASSRNAIMYPDEFIFVIQQFPGGNEVLLDNIDDIMKKNNFKRDKMTMALSEVEGIEEKFLNDFQTKFYLFVNGNTEKEEDMYSEEYFNPTYRLTEESKAFRALRFLKIASKGKDAAEIFEENKEIFISPRYNEVMPEIVNLLVSNPELHNFLRNNFERIIKCSKEEDIVNIYKTIQNVYPEKYEEHRFVIEKIFDKANEKIESKKTKITQDDYQTMTNQVRRTCGRVIAQKQSKDIESVIEVIDKDKNIDICGIGAYSIVLKVNGKVLKIGGDRLNSSQFEIPNHPRLLRPIIRKKDVSVLKNHPIYFEIQDEVDTDTEITDEELLQVYKELREAGIKWYDARKENLGRLKADNFGYPIGMGVPANNKSIGFKGEDVIVSPLKKGDLVVIDLDLLCLDDYAHTDFAATVPEFIIKFEEEFCKTERKSPKQTDERSV